MRSFLFVAALLAACSTPADDDDGANCVETQTDCTPQYEPTFDNVHSRTLVPSCALSGACHGDPDAQGGFSLVDADTAYEELSRRVEPGDTECGTLMWRLHVDQPAAQMPPGMPLPAGEMCAVVQWVEQGAER